MESNTASGSELWDTTDSEDDTVDFSDDKSDGACHLRKGKDTKSSCDSGNLSDIKDAEVNSYLNNEKQKHYKKIIWEMMNQKYLDEQEARKKMAALNVPNPKKKQRNITAKDGKKAADKTQPTASKKRPSTRINFEALQKMFEEEEPEPKQNIKRARTESESAKAQDDESELGGYDEGEEQNEWEENTRYSHYNDQDEDYYYDDGEDLY